ncbi:MAG: TatD family hydrolase, partial [Candidatus Binatia bacterium]
MAWKPLDHAPDLPSLGGETLIDSHCHLDGGDFDADRGEVLARAAAAGVGTMVTIGAGGPLECNDRALALAEAHASVFATVGVHPHEAAQVDDAIMTSIEALARRPKVVGIGETGLDYHYDHSPRPQQRAAFARFIQLARRLALPVVVHLRDADDDAVDLLRGEQAGEVGGVIHCFSGDADSARRFLDLGFHISFSGIVTFKTADALRAAARIVPSDRLMVETDAPFLAPIPYRGRRNEPALVVQTAVALAEIRGETLEQVAASTRANT